MLLLHTYPPTHLPTITYIFTYPPINQPTCLQKDIFDKNI